MVGPLREDFIRYSLMSICKHGSLRLSLWIAKGFFGFLIDLILELRRILFVSFVPHFRIGGLCISFARR